MTYNVGDKVRWRNYQNKDVEGTIKSFYTRKDGSTSYTLSNTQGDGFINADEWDFELIESAKPSYNNYDRAMGVL